MRRSLAILLCLLAACAAPSSATRGEKGGLVSVKVDQAALSRAYEPRRLALLVGVSQFDDSHWHKLRFAQKDAEDLADALRDSARGRFNQVRVLTRPEDTTRSAILSALDELQQQAHRPDDVVVVYFSAHGTLARDERGELRRYLVTRDTSYGAIAETALSMDALKARIDTFPSRRRLLVLAACHSGSGKSLLPRELEAELAGIKSGFHKRPLEESSRASIVFSACDWGETAREDVRLRNDIYTHYLVQGLGGAADRNLDGAVMATEAHDYARRRTHLFTDGRQRPSAEILEVGADPVVLAGQVQQQGHPELVSYLPQLDGFTLKVDGESRTELPGGAAVTPGRHQVSLEKGGSVLLKTEVEVALGERVALEQLLDQTLPHRSVALMGGVLSFLDARSREELLPAMPQLAVVLRLERPSRRELSLLLDVSASQGQAHLLLAPTVRVPFGYAAFSVGAALPYQWELDRLSLYTGVRVAALWLRRSFQTQAFTGTQDYFTLSPGLVGGVVWRLGERLELLSQVQLMGTYVMVDGEGHVLGFTGGWAGVGYRF